MNKRKLNKLQEEFAPAEYSSFMVVTVFLVLISGTASLIAPLLIQYWSKDEKGLVTQRGVLLCGVLIGSALIELLSVYVREKFAKKFNVNNCKYMLDIFLHMQYDKIVEIGPSKITARIRQAVNDLYMYYVGSKITICASSFVISALLIMSIVYNWKFAIILAIVVVVNICGYRVLNKELLRRSEKLQENTAAGWQEINTAVETIDYIKQLENYDFILMQLQPSINRIYDAMKEINIFAQTISHGLLSFNNFVQTMIVLFITFRFFQQKEDAYSLIFYTIILPLFFMHLSKLVNANLDKRNVVVSRDFVKEMKELQEKNGKENVQSIEKISFQIEKISNISLKKPIITESFVKGDMIWVKGKSGCGKSTLMKYLVKFRETKGILINGHEIFEYSNQSIRKHIEYVPQSAPIIKGTLRDNLFLGKPYSSIVEQEMNTSPLLESILRSKTLDSMITENGGNLSGGEKQKIEIARILASEADVLILDEITSNVDAETADMIYSTLLQLHRNKIIFIISHDKNIQKHCNKCIAL